MQRDVPSVGIKAVRYLGPFNRQVDLPLLDEGGGGIVSLVISVLRLKFQKKGKEVSCSWYKETLTQTK